MMVNQIVTRKGDAPPARGFIGSLRSAKVLGALLAVVNYIFIFIVLMTSVLPKQYSLKVGDIVQTPIGAPWDVEDIHATEELRQTAKDSVSPIYRFDERITESVMEEIEDIFVKIDGARILAEEKFIEYKLELQAQQTNNDQIEEGQEEEAHETGEDIAEPSPDEILTDQFISEIRNDFPIMLSKDEILTCLNADIDELHQLREHLLTTLNGLLELHIKQDNLLEAKNALREEMMSLPISNEIRILGTSIGVSALRSNMLPDETATEEERVRAAENVEPVMYKKGQYIVQAGQPISHQQYAMLQKLGLLKEEKMNVPILLGIGIIILLIELMVILFLAAFEKRLLDNPAHLLMMSLIVWMVMGLAIATSQLHQYLIPTALGAMLLTILTGPFAAGIINVALSLLFGVMFENSLSIIIMTLVGGIVGIYICNNAKQRNGLIWAGIAASIVNLASIFALEMMSSGGWFTSLKTSLWGIGGGLLSGIFLVGTLPIWENLFGIVTPIKLVELANPNHPILKRMLMEAPGTYHHSVIVANLAENAAEAIGADGLLARVGAYYHDTGKLKRPFYFKENQIAMGNPHDKLSPTLSTHIITSHVKDGIDLAKKHKVPKVIQDFILQHHGTTAVAYFYHKAKEQDEDGSVHMDDFRYAGPKPRKRETAIVMMADTVEAAVRSISDPTPEKVEALIHRLVKSKLDDGQLDDCHLTLKDLNTISNAFTGVMTGFFHERVEYPKTSEKQESIGGETDNGYA
ncbi:MAG TPA: HDIG domain-containing protein [Clostridia bacterium]|nr:HDIG domain-containing protein [Clostridia bacterium]